MTEDKRETFDVKETDINTQAAADAAHACQTLAQFALYCKETKGAEIMHSPIVQEIGIELDEQIEEEEDFDTVEPGRKAFRITVQQIPLEELPDQ